MKTIVKAGILGIAFLVCNVALNAQSGPYQYYPLTPCRVVDTRGPNSTNGGPRFDTATQRNFQIRGNCGVSSAAKAVALNVTVVNETQPSWLALWPSGVARPLISNINFYPESGALANGCVVPLSTNAQDLSVFNSDGLVDVIIDVTGYFQ